MSAQARVRQPYGSGVRIRTALKQVLDPERELEEALGLPAARARRGRVELLCEVLAGVGSHVLGDSRLLRRTIGTRVMDAVAAVEGHLDPEVWVRVARQFSGFEPTSGVLVSVGNRITTAHEELVLPLLEASDATPVDDAACRLLVVVPSERGARIQRDAAVRAGAQVTVARAADVARQQLRFAAFTGTPYDMVYVDDALGTSGRELMAELREDPSLGSPAVILATTDVAASEIQRLGVASLIAKPVLPRALKQALVASRRTVTARSLRVLVAEDDPLVARASQHAVRKLGHEPVHVTSGRDAAELLSSGGFDAALLDVGLPELDGLSVARLMRRRESGTMTRLTIIIVSAGTPDARLCAEASVDAVVAKPVGSVALAAVLGDAGKRAA